MLLGVRYTLFNPLGPDTTYKYTAGAPRDTRYIEDTLIFGKNEVIHCWYHEPEIRASVNIQTDKEGSIKLAFNQMHQNLFMLNTITTVAPNTQWKMADYHLLPSRSNLASVGLFRTLPKERVGLSAEVCYKRPTISSLNLRTVRTLLKIRQSNIFCFAGRSESLRFGALCQAQTEKKT